MYKSIFYILIISGLLFHSISGCQKELNCGDCTGNLPPVANAGRDTSINTSGKIILDGRQSTDPDGNIIQFKWRTITGPDSLVILNDTLPATSAEKIKPGLYKFELTVTDNLGSFDKDSVEISVVNRDHLNRPPVARAGSDSVINLLTSGVLLNGSNSFDPDNNIAKFEWLQISTRAVASIANPDYKISQVTFSGIGEYVFTLRVTDSLGLYDIDTITYTIQAISNNFCSGITRTNILAKTIPIGKLSIPRRLGAVMAAGNKIVFAGGYPDYDDNPVTTVDIFDTDSRQWSQSSLSSPRVSMGTAVLGNKIFFAGGIDYELDFARGPTFSDVDIYNADDNTWVKKNLSQPRMGLAGASLNGKLFFAGGASEFAGQLSSDNKMSDRIDIYSPATDSWDTSHISIARYDLKANLATDRIYFAGGSAGERMFKSRVDILNSAGAVLPSTEMNMTRVDFNSISFDNKIMWIGGYTIKSGVGETTAQVEIFDARSGTSVIHCLNSPTAWYLGHNGVVQWKKWIVVFPDMVYNPSVFEIYNIETNRWHIGILDREIYWPSVIVAKDKLYVADGASGEVWNIEF